MIRIGQCFLSASHCNFHHVSNSVANSIVCLKRSGLEAFGTTKHDFNRADCRKSKAQGLHEV